MEITIGTGNIHKLGEMQAINPFKEIKLKKIEGEFNPKETGKTFEENAYIKAKAASEIIKSYAFADDTGLCIDALNGAPGLYTARYAKTQPEKIAKILKEMKGIPLERRTARFICSIVLTDKRGNIIHKTEGEIEGYIAEQASGTGGFGYDPIFYVKEYGKTIAELPEEEKNRISHRAKALIPMLKYIKEQIKEKT